MSECSGRAETSSQFPIPTGNFARHGFVRINRRTLVNLGRVRELRPGFKGGVWVLVDGSSTPIDVARRRVPALRAALLTHPG